MPEAQKPYCLALILCELVHRSPSTGQFSMLGTFNRLKSSQLPIPAKFAIYFAVTDGAGPCALGVRIVDSRSIVTDDLPEDAEAGLPDIPVQLNFSDPFSIAEGVLHFQMHFPRSGVYHCELYAGDDCPASAGTGICRRLG
jgi:hypothetical protein